MAFEILKPEWGAQRPIRGILFDMDGLVLDTERLYTRFWMEAAQVLGYPMTKKQALGLRSLGKASAQPLLESYFGVGVSYDEIRAKRIELMDAFIAEHGIAPKTGIFELLDYLQEAGIASAITSSSPMEMIRRHLTSQNLYHRFDKLCSGHEVPKGKPAPDIYLHGAAVLGLESGECLALEDSPAGIVSAYRAGCLPVIIPDQDEPTEETLAMCYGRADTLADLIPMIKQRNGHL